MLVQDEMLQVGASSLAHLEESASDSDGPNASTSRIYFGPPQSEERKITRKSTRRRTIDANSPIRRSARLSMPATASPLRRVNNDSDQDTETDGEVITKASFVRSPSRTPSNHRFIPEEPSSVLADKVLHAHDNPSPPPQTNELPAETDDEVLVPVVSDSPTPHPVLEIATPPSQDEMQTTPRLPPLPALFVHEASPTPEVDLMTFDPVTPPPSSVEEASADHTGDGKSLTDQFIASSVDISDRLTNSPPRLTPVRRSARLSMEHVDSFNRSAEGIIVPIQGPEQTVTNNQEGSKGGLEKQRSPSATPPPDTSDSSTSHPDDSPPQQPIPTRRSPRHNATPVTLEAALQAASIVDEGSTNLETPTKGKAAQLLMPPLPALVRGSRKGKERAISPGSSGMSDSEGNASGNNASRSCSVEPPLSDFEEKGRRRAERRSQSPERMKKMRSLSPDSAEVLTQLFRPSNSPVDHLFQNPLPSVPSDNEASDNPRTPQRPTNSIFPDRAIIAATIARPPSPTKTGLSQVSAVRSPPRRIPIQEAYARGTASPPKASYLGIQQSRMVQSSPSLTKAGPALITMLSPARRVQINVEPMTPNRLASPVRPTSAAGGRSGSVEPRSRLAVSKPSHPRASSVDRHLDQRSALSVSKGAIFVGPLLGRANISSSKLPFPLVPKTPSKDIPASIPEKEISVEAQKGQKPSPTKSALRQPVNSRIPRIENKPYARPPSAPRRPGVSSPLKSAAHKRSSAPSTTGPRSGSSLDDIRYKSTISPVTGGPKVATLKRKREVGNKPPPPAAARTTRAVLPGTFGPKYQPLPTSTKVPSPSSALNLNLISPSTLDLGSNTHNTPEQTSAGTSFENERHPIDGGNTDDASCKRQRLDMAPAETSYQEQGPSTPTPPSQATIHVNSADVLQTATPDSDNETSASLRRTTRHRKQPHPSTDAPASRPPPFRRKPPSSRSEPVFAGLNAVALKALTTNNTVKNQEYQAAKLETEVIRKDGERPDSPTTSVRTMIQRQREEKDKERKLRAERRARKSDEGLMGLEEGDESMDWESSSNMQSSPMRFNNKHRRGPGEEEDYETPVKSGDGKRPAEVVDDDEGRIQKRVKWDRGLFYAAILEEIEPNPKSRPKDEVIQRGCLSQAAKALTLDSHGNISTDSPLQDLVHENIVVKKFIYEGDPLPEAVAAPTVKVTRSKSKDKN